jgi:hypothetical protein
MEAAGELKKRANVSKALRAQFGPLIASLAPLVLFGVLQRKANKKIASS